MYMHLVFCNFGSDIIYLLYKSINHFRAGYWTSRQPANELTKQLLSNTLILYVYTSNSDQQIPFLRCFPCTWRSRSKLWCPDGRRCRAWMLSWRITNCGSSSIRLAPKWSSPRAAGKIPKNCATSYANSCEVVYVFWNLKSQVQRGLCQYLPWPGCLSSASLFGRGLMWRLAIIQNAAGARSLRRRRTTVTTTSAAATAVLAPVRS